MAVARNANTIFTGTPHRKQPLTSNEQDGEALATTKDRLKN